MAEDIQLLDGMCSFSFPLSRFVLVCLAVLTLNIRDITCAGLGRTKELRRSVLGFTCVGECVRSATGSYWWCHAADVGWDYCTPKLKQPNQKTDTLFETVIASNGEPCKTECAREGSTSYFWCRTTVEGAETPPGDIVAPKHTWDYCSPTPGRDYYGRKCRGECAFGGKRYKWCETERGSWGYC